MWYYPRDIASVSFTTAAYLLQPKWSSPENHHVSHDRKVPQCKDKRDVIHSHTKNLYQIKNKQIAHEEKDERDCVKGGKSATDDEYKIPSSLSINTYPR